MRLPWVSRRRYEWAYQRGQLQGNADAREVFRKRIEELESFDANDYLAASHNGAEDMRAACIAALTDLTEDMRNWSSPETRAATDAIPDLSMEQWIWVQRGIHRAIAAIEEVQP